MHGSVASYITLTCHNSLSSKTILVTLCESDHCHSMLGPSVYIVPSGCLIFPHEFSLPSVLTSVYSR